MKKLFTFVAISVTATLFANEPVKQKEVKKEDSGTAVYCKITTPTGTVIECYLCDCKKLAEQFQKNE